MNYIALTIGPIYKTLANAKKPKELFASSYIFSYIMREIIQQFKEREFITPYIKDETIFDETSEVGLFHDRFIFQSEEGDAKKLQSVIEEVAQDVAKELNLQANQVLEYLQIHTVEKELDEDKNPILELSPYLDTAELFFQTTQDESFAQKLRRKKGDEDNFLTKDKNIVDDLKRLSYHKYYCIVHADGDNMSKAIADKNKIEDVSKNLFEYCQNAHKSIKNFGGQTIFAGGDDLLFFAPVVGKEKETIFELCETIAQDFQKRFKDLATLSFGITVNYIKFPLYEALENSREQLFAKAKNEKKNNIAFKVTKHSGQTFETLVHKGDKIVYEQFLAFVKNVADEKENEQFLHSMHHKLDMHKTTLQHIKKDKTKLQNFFDNYFNEDEHKEYRNFFETLTEFIYVSQDLDLVYATLRFIKFIKGDK